MIDVADARKIAGVAAKAGHLFPGAVGEVLAEEVWSCLRFKFLGPGSRSWRLCQAVAAMPLLVVPASNTVTGTYPVSCHRAAGDGSPLPVRSCAPGSIRDDLTDPTPARLAVTICRPGWTTTVRPPESETRLTKRAAMRAYGEPAGESRIIELDHLVPLELGGPTM